MSIRCVRQKEEEWCKMEGMGKLAFTGIVAGARRSLLDVDLDSKQGGGRAR
jgi:hypothetical protein